MIRNDSRSGKRSAFTLVELLVVVLIIAILVSLLSSAVMKAMGRIPEVKTRTEIAEMDVALRAFMTDYGLVDPPPSSLVLYENISNYTVPPMSQYPGAAQSYAFLQKVFGKNLGPQVDWDGSGNISPSAAPWHLEGEYCLVFYIGGIPSPTGAPQGFSTNNMKPSYGSMLGETMGKRKGPYFTFDMTRLRAGKTLNPAALGFMVYIDPWQSKQSPFYNAPYFLGGTPYAYFSSRGTNNAYSLVAPGDCPTIKAAPYFITATTQCMNSNGYQIISAGKDGVFGTNGWVPASGAVGPGADDQANFSAGLLGNGQQ